MNGVTANQVYRYLHFSVIGLLTCEIIIPTPTVNVLMHNISYSWSINTPNASAKSGNYVLR